MVLRAYLEEELGGSSEFLPPLPDAQSLCLLQSSSFSSITDSTMSLNIITVTLNMGEASGGPRGGGGLGGVLTAWPTQRGTTSWASASWARATTGVTAASTSAPS